MSGGVVHIAGVHIQIGALIRQRCVWCGATLIDYDLRNIVVEAGDDRGPAVWPVGDLIRVDGAVSFAMEHVDGAPLPDASCGKLDPEVTR